MVVQTTEFSIRRGVREHKKFALGFCKFLCREIHKRFLLHSKNNVPPHLETSRTTILDGHQKSKVKKIFEEIFLILRK